jgi:hypothetical protein
MDSWRLQHVKTTARGRPDGRAVHAADLARRVGPTAAPPARDRRWRASACAAVIGAIILLLHSLTAAQEISPLRLKAAFIWNFAKFTDWPGGAIRAGDPFTMCVVGNAVLADALEVYVRGRVLGNRKVVVTHAKAAEQPPGACQVLFVSGGAKQVSQILSAIRDSPVLSISDIDGAAEMGAIVQFLYVGSQLNFSVQRDSATRAKLQISSQVLQLSKPR